MQRLGGVFTSRLVDLCTEDGTKMNFLSFLGLVDTPHTVAKVTGALSPKQQDFRRSIAPQRPKTSATL